MKTTGSVIIVALAALLCGCAATAPSELVNARLAYQHASTGPAVQMAPADLHKAKEALAEAEAAFSRSASSYHTRDLAYVAQRTAEMADAQASIAMEQKDRARADRNFQVTQGNMLQEKTQDLNETRTALANSEQNSEATARRLSAEQMARREAEKRTAEQTTLTREKTQDLTETRTALALSEQRGQAKTEELSTEQNARIEAEKRAAVAQAALAKIAAVTEDERGTVITLSGSVLFRSGDSTLMSSAQSRLAQVADALLTDPDRNIVVEGYTDSQGSDMSNLALSQRRADTVRDYLVYRGYPAGRMQAHGIGEGSPIADNATAEGRANNRRVEIVLERLAER